MGLKIEVVGIEAVKKQFRSNAQVLRVALGVGLYRVGAAIASDSIRMAPKLTGTLRGSAYCTLPASDGGAVSVTAGYGGYAKKYAWVQENGFNFRHTEGGPYFLARAVQAYQAKAGDIVLDVVRSSLKNGRAVSLLQQLNSNPDSGPTPGKRQGTTRGSANKQPRRGRSRK